MRKALLGLTLLTTGLVASAEHYFQDVNKNDNLFFNFKIMHGQGQKNPFNNQDDTYLEVEFGGRKGILDLYGYIDLKNFTGSTDNDSYGGDNFFAEIKPRFSIDGMTGKDLSIRPFKEWYISTWIKAGDSGKFGGLWHNGIGLGTDVEVPWFGTTGLSLLSTYKREDFGSNGEGKWDGYSLQGNWFKPLHFFENGSFVSYQGYVTYDFGTDEVDEDPGRTKDSLQWYNGIYWHNSDWAIGYGLKVYNNMANFDDGYENAFGQNQGASGVRHYFDIGYKF
ncbi:outer membrane protein OmpK [Psychrilyobacter sp.]|uniref:nucleoside-specific channel-forming Tsx family protein n=1 Tax=Psychrilyobacter sp. TaxID=2586924 RepID=UPI00301A75DA